MLYLVSYGHHSRVLKTGIYHFPWCDVKSGRGREIRTPDILLPKQARYQTALYPDYCCTGTSTGPVFRWAHHTHRGGERQRRARVGRAS